MNSRTTEAPVPSCAVENEEFLLSRGKEICTKNKGSILGDLLIPMQRCVTVAVDLIVREAIRQLFRLEHE